MIEAAEIAGLVVVVAVLTNAVVMAVFAAMHRSREAAGQRLALEVFREQAQVHLEAARSERDRVEQSWNGVRKFVVHRKVEEARDVFSFYLKPHDHKPLPPFEPGQYLTFRLNPPDAARPVVRCYSLSDTPLARDHYRVTIKKTPGVGDHPPGLASSHFADRVQEGDIVDVMAPSGHFCLDMTSERPIVLLAGGVGLTPLMSMLLSVVGSGSRRETWFFYGVRNRAEHAMADELRRLANEHPNVHIVICYSSPTESCKEGFDFDHHGRIDLDLLRSTLPSNNFEYYICGPSPMMDALTAALETWGVPDEDVFFEAFGPASTKRTTSEAEASEYEVLFARSGNTCTWTADEGSLLDLAEQHGINLDSGCRAGSCGSCLTAIREGEVEYSIEPGAPPQDGSCLACIAHPKGRLVLDA